LDLFGYNKLEKEKVKKAMLDFHIHPFFFIFSLLLAQSPLLIGSSTLLSCFRKQNTKFWFYVDSFITSHGSCNYHSHAFAHGEVSPYDFSFINFFFFIYLL